MDYIDIILRGYTNENDRRFLSKYFIREQKNALKENYSFEEFFTGLITAFESLKKDCEIPFNNRINELYLMLDGAKNKTLKYQDLENLNIEEKYNQTIEYCESEILSLSVNDFSLNLLGYGNKHYIGHLYFNELEFIGNEITTAFEEFNKPKIKKNKKDKILTNDTYFKIIEECTEEAFESLKLKDFYPQDGSKAIWDVSGLTISIQDRPQNEADNKRIRKSYIIENMTSTFLLAIERYFLKFEKKHSVTRSFFYKKCFQAILVKKSNSSTWNKPALSFDIDNPCKWTFIWEMAFYIEGRSQDNQQPIPEAETSTVEKKEFHKKEVHSEIFSNNGFELFEHILIEHVKPKDTKGRKSDLIYYYWEMYNSNPQYIHQRPATFFKWFDNNHNETTGQLKTYDNVKTTQRKKDYSTALEWFKSKNK